MRSEVAHLPDASASSFAWGCVWASLRARLASPGFILHAARWVLVLGALGWSVGNLWLGGRLSSVGAALPAKVAYASATVYFSGAVLTAVLGLRATTALTTPVLLLVGLIAAGTDVLLPPSPHNALYRALALEQTLLLAVVLLIAGGVPRWVAARGGPSR
jgi:hypothetical protein